MPEPHLPPGTRRAAALVALVLLVLAFPTVFFGGRTLRNGPGMPGVVPTGVYGEPSTLTPAHTMDSVSAFIDEPLAQVMARDLREGRLPLWNPWNGCGAPLLGNMQSAPLSPFRWPVLAFPDTPWVYDAALLLRLFAAGFFTFLYVAQRGLAKIAAATAAGAFMLTGYFVLHVSMHHLSVEVLLPALFFFLDRFALRPAVRRSSFLGLLLTGWGTIVGGNPEATILVVLPAAAYVLAHVRAWGLRTVLGITGTLALAAGLGAPYLLAGAEYLANATHHHQGVAAGLDHYQPWTLIAYLAPGAFGDVNPVAPPYLGAPAVLLAVLGASRRTTVPRRFLAALAVVLLAKALGCPGIDLLGRLPVLDLLYFYKYGNPALAFAVAVLAAGGVQAIQADRVPWRGAALLLVALPLLWLLAQLPSWLVAVPAEAGPVAGSWWRSGAVILCLGVFFSAAAEWRRLGRGVNAFLAGVCVVLPLLAPTPSALPPRLPTYREAPYVAQLRADSRPFRTFGVEDALPPNVNAVVRLADVRSHDGLYAARFDRYIAEFLNPNNHSPQFDGRLLYPQPADQLEQELRMSAFFLHRGLDRLLRSHNSFTMDFTSDQKMKGYDLAGVRYVLFNPALLTGAQAFVAARPDRWRLAYSGEMVALENLKAFPRAFLARAARSVADPDAAVAALKSADFPLARTIALEGDPGALPASLPAGEPDFRSTPGCTLTAYSADAVQVRIDAPTQGFLVLTDTFFPGWTAEVDGQPAVIEPANLLFRAVRVTPAARVVTFRYRPRPLLLGAWLAAGCALLAAVVALRMGRRLPLP